MGRGLIALGLVLVWLWGLMGAVRLFGSSLELEAIPATVKAHPPSLLCCSDFVM